MANSSFEPLFQPFKLGNLALENRIIFPPMGLEVCHDGVRAMTRRITTPAVRPGAPAW